MKYCRFGTKASLLRLRKITLDFRREIDHVWYALVSIENKAAKLVC